MEHRPSFARRLLQLNVLVAACACSIAAAAAVLAGASVSWAAIGAVFCTSFGVYNFDRLADTTPTEGRSTPGRTATISRSRAWLKLSIPIGFAIAVVLGFTHGTAALAWTLAFPLLGVAYGLPLLPFERVRRIKDIPGFKSFYVASCWTTFVAVGLAYSDASAGATIAGFAIFVWVRSFLSAFLSDMRDIHDDAEAGIVTLPNMLGLDASRRLGHALHLSSLLGVVAAVALGAMPAFSFALVVPACFGYASFVAFGHMPRYHELIVELYDFEVASYAGCLLATHALFG